MGWDVARSLLNNSVVNGLGEELLLESSSAEATVRGVLVRPESLARLGLSVTEIGAARLTLKRADVPAWFYGSGSGRGRTVTAESGETYDVTAIDDNGEGVLEVTLCRSS